MFSWPKSRTDQPPSSKKFDLTGVKKDLSAAGAKDLSPNKLCVGFQIMYALSSNFADDDKRLAYAYRFCPCPKSGAHNSVTSGAHVQAAGLDRTLLLKNEI